MFTSVSQVVPEYDSSRMMIYAQMRTGERVVVVRQCVTVAFLTSFFCVWNVGETLQKTQRISHNSGILHLADKVSLTFCTQKNGVKNSTVTKW